MFLIIRKRVLRRIAAITAVVAVLAAGFGWQYSRQTAAEAEPDEPDFIRWVDFQASYEALEAALELDIASQETDTPVSWIDLIALAAAKNGNNFSSFKRRELEGYVQQLQEGKTLEELTEKLSYFPYYREAYGAALGGLVGHFEIEVDDETAPGGKRFEPQYGLKAFLPIAKGYPYSDYDDFGVSRWRAAWWKRSAGTSMEAGGSVSAASTANVTITTLIFARISLSINHSKRAASCSRAMSSATWGIPDTAPPKMSTTSNSRTCISACS